MSDDILKNKPLVEAIFEIRWIIDPLKDEQRVDPHYKLIVGRLFDAISDDYGFHEALPTADFPEQITSHVVQHRFRKNENGWPLMQIGPGIATVNDTDSYVWGDFQERIKKLLHALFSSYEGIKGDPKPQMKPVAVFLRYIDAIEFDYQKHNVFEFLRDNLKADFQIGQSLFDAARVKNMSHGFDLKFTYPLVELPAILQLRFSRGKKFENDALIWETQIISQEKDAKDIPTTFNQLIDWSSKAHDVTHKWFFEAIDGELRKRFA